MPHQQYTAITQHRLRALTEFAESTDSGQVILWLFNRSRGGPELLLSYAVGFSLDQLNAMRDLHVSLPDGWAPDFQGHRPVSDDIELSLRIELESAGIREQDFNMLPLAQPNAIDQKEYDFTGIVLCNSNSLPQDNTTLQLSILLLTERIESLRLSRLRNAAIGVQSAFKERNTNVDMTLKKIGDLLKVELGAKQCEFTNSNTATQSYIIPSNSIDAHLNSPSRRIAAASFTIQQDSLLLEKRPFRPSHDLVASFTRLKTNELLFRFVEKSRNGYLQSCFSDTDQMVANHVFGYIEP